MSTQILLDRKYAIDLGEDPVKIPLTYSLIDIKDLNKRKGASSKTITVPRTQLNEKLFGIPSNLNATNQFSKYDLRKILIIEDSYIIFDGLFQLADIQENISFFCVAEVSKFKGISGIKRLQDLQLDDLNHTYDQTIFDTWVGTYPSGVPADYFYPVLDYGQFETRSSNGELQTQIFVGDLYPAIYLKRAIQQICVDNGYSLVSKFFDDPIHRKMLLPFCNEKFIVDSKYNQSKYGVYLKGSYDFTPVTPDDSAVVPFTAFIDEQAQWDGDEYTAAQNQTIRISYELNVQNLPATIAWPNPSKLELVTQKWDGLTWTDVLINPISGNYSAPIITRTYSLLTGEMIRFLIRALDVDTDFTVTITMLELTIIPINDGLTDISFGGTVQLAPNLPDMKQIDLFTYCYKMFNWVIDVDDSQGVIYIESYTDYYAGNIPIDMTRKMVLAPLPIKSYRDENFSRSYTFGYTHDENDYYLSIYDGRNLSKVRYPFGDGELILSQQDEPTVIGPIGFSPTVIEKTFLAEPYFYINLPLAWKRDRDVGVKDTKIFPRILINAGLIDVEKLSDGTRENVKLQVVGLVEQLPLCYFQKITYNDDIDLFDLNLSMDIPEAPTGLTVWNGIGLKERFYEQVIKDLSSSAKEIAWFTLTAADIATLSYRRFWYLDQEKAFFRVGRLLNYQPGSKQSTQVELIKVGVFYEIKESFINFDETVFRITEADEIRQLENNDLRIIE